MGRIYQLLGPHGRRQPVADGARRPSRRRTPPTSPTAPTTSSASTTCATTWCSRRRSACSAASHYAIVDEVDSILIDEARTPLIISGQADDNVDLYYRLNELAPKLARQAEGEGPGDYWVDEKAHQVLLSEAGPRARRGRSCSAAGLLAAASSLYDAHNIALMHHLYAALRAHALFHARPALRRAERRGDHRRRVHRPPDVGPPLVRRPAPGGRGEGRRADPAREPDARVDHVPELLPDVRQARRHDGHAPTPRRSSSSRSTTSRRW